MKFLLNLFLLSAVTALPTEEPWTSKTRTPNNSPPRSPPDSVARPRQLPLIEEPVEWDLFAKLPEDVQRRILVSLSPDDQINHYRSLLLASKDANSLVRSLGFSAASSVGHPKRIHSNLSVCRTLKAHPQLYSTIQFLYVTNRVYEECAFSRQRLPALKQLTIQVTIDSWFADPTGDSAEEMQAALATEVPQEPTTPIGFEDTVQFKHTDTLYSYWLRLTHHHRDGVQIDVINEKQVTVLQDLIIRPGVADRLDKVRDMLQSGRIDVQRRDRYGASALHYCFAPDLFMLPSGAVIDAVKCVELLLHFGANPNAIDRECRTPVHYAASSLSAVPMKRLLAAGAHVDPPPSPRLPSCYDAPPPLFASMRRMASRKLTEARHLLPQTSLARTYRIYQLTEDNLRMWMAGMDHQVLAHDYPALTLVDAGAQLTGQLGRGNALHYALSLGIPYLALRMLHRPSKDLPLFEHDQHDCSLLQKAAQVGEAQLIRKMLSFQVFDVNHMGGRCPPPLISSILNVGDFDAILALLNAGANPLIITSEGWTPIYAALISKKFNPDVVLALLQRGARLDAVHVHPGSKTKISLLSLMLIHISELPHDPSSRKAAIALAKAVLGWVDSTSSYIPVPEEHLLLYTVYRLHDSSLVEFMSQIKNLKTLYMLKSPFIDGDGLVLSEEGLQSARDLYVNISLEEGYHTKKYLVKHNTRLYAAVKSLVLEWSSDFRDVWTVSRSVRHVTLFWKGLLLPNVRQQLQTEIARLFPDADVQLS